MKKRYDIKEFQASTVQDILKNEQKTVFPAHFYKSFHKGKNTYYQRETIESNRFDDLWIRTIESYFPSLDRITINLRSALKYQSEIIPVEKTKKISKDSVIHLMSHSNYVREVTEDGVIPKQILSHLPEIEYGIYENRFVMTLIDRVRDFINRRLKIMREKVKALRAIHLNINSQMEFEESNLEVTIDIKQKHEVERRKVDEHNIKTLERAENLFKLVSRLHNTQFMRTLRQFKPVTSPIMKTQVILKNPDFRNAYMLWLYLDRHTDLGYQHDLKSVNKHFSDEYVRNLNQSMLMLCTALFANDKSGRIDRSLDTKPTYRQRKARVLKRLPFEIAIEPTAYEVENTGINEYYLERNRQILKKQYQELIEEGNNPKIALKKALTESLSITNALYESFFEYNADEDLFYFLIKEKNIEERYKEVYDKYIIACSVREVKERDFRRIITLERRWQEELQRVHTQLTEYEREVEGKKTQDILDELKARYQDRLDIINARDFQEKRSLIRKNRAEADALRRRLREEYREKRKQLLEENKKRLATERERIREWGQAAQLRAEQLHRETLSRMKKEHRLKMEQLVEQSREQYNKQKENLVEKYNQRIDRQKKRIRERLERKSEERRQSIIRNKQSMQKRQKTRRSVLLRDKNLRLKKQEERLRARTKKEITAFREKTKL